MYLDKERLGLYLAELEEKVKTKTEREIVYICHCTGKKAKRLIISDGVIKGGETDLPSYAPLARNAEIEGTWFSLTDDILPGISPYGTQRMSFSAPALMSYLVNTAEEESQGLRLFFECAYFYGNTQYVRFLLVRTSSPEHVLEWCEKTCNEINLSSNSFFEYKDGRIWSRALKKMAIDVLIVGDIHLDRIQPEWRQIKKSQRAGRDPVMGLL